MVRGCGRWCATGKTAACFRPSTRPGWPGRWPGPQAWPRRGGGCCGNAALRTAGDFSMERTAGRVLDLYRQAVRRPAPAQGGGGRQLGGVASLFRGGMEDPAQPDARRRKCSAGPGEREERRLVKGLSSNRPLFPPVSNTNSNREKIMNHGVHRPQRKIGKIFLRDLCDSQATGKSGRKIGISCLGWT